MIEIQCYSNNIIFVGSDDSLFIKRFDDVRFDANYDKNRFTIYKGNTSHILATYPIDKCIIYYLESEYISLSEPEEVEDNLDELKLNITLTNGGRTPYSISNMLRNINEYEFEHDIRKLKLDPSKIVKYLNGNNCYWCWKLFKTTLNKLIFEGIDYNNNKYYLTIIKN